MVKEIGEIMSEPSNEEILLADDVRDQLKKIFAGVPPVTVIAVIDEGKSTCIACPKIKQLLKEMQETLGEDKFQLTITSSENKEVVEKYRLDETPAIIIEGKNKGIIRYLGIPSGHEFGVFVEALKDAALDHFKDHVPDSEKERIEKINKPVRIRVFVTPTCPYCPMAVFVAYSIAALNPFIIGEAIEAEEFPELSQKFKVHAVPTIVINDKVRVEGAIGVDDMLDKIEEALESED